MKKFFETVFNKLGLGVGSLISCDNMIVTNIKRIFGDNDGIDIRVSQSTSKTIVIEINAGDDTFYVKYSIKPFDIHYVITDIDMYFPILETKKSVA